MFGGNDGFDLNDATSDMSVVGGELDRISRSLVALLESDSTPRQKMMEGGSGYI
jgi:hypothetical protein